MKELGENSDKKFVVAVSGGVDSVVLLDMLSKRSDLELIVAHFDHGIREDSARDAEFVADLAKKYNLPFEMKREELGANASEEEARISRYDFLREVANKYDAKIVTAHHGDDVIESIAINLTRGTGWRGLAAVDSDIVRPLTNIFKNKIIQYAKDNKLDWHEDSTNQSEDYLRNRIRQKLARMDQDTKLQLLGLWSQQKYLKSQIDKEVENILDTNNYYSRYFFIQIDEKPAVELLRFATKTLLTRPQLSNLLIVIKTFQPNTLFEAGNGVKVQFSSRNFTVELLE